MGHDISRLPKWAQEIIVSLKCQLGAEKRRCKKMLDQLSGEEKTNVFLHRHFPEEDIPLEKDARIRFLLQDGDSIFVDHHEECGLVIRKDLGLVNAIHVLPECTNSIIVY